MLHIATILHPTDFSPIAEHAFQLACSLARDHESQIIVLHVAEPPVVGYGSMLTPPPQGDRTALEEQLQRIQPPDPKIPVLHQLVVGTPVTEILRIAQESQCDLIVMGTHGRTGLEHLLMGSVAEQIVRKAPCPVLVAKTVIPEMPLRETAHDSAAVPG